MKFRSSVILVIVGLVLLISSINVGGSEGSEPQSEEPTRATNYTSAYSYELGSHYIGSEVDFRIIVGNNYNGNEWKGDAYTWQHDDLFYVKLSILNQEVEDEEGRTKSSMISAAAGGSLSPYNGAQNQGFNMSSSRVYYMNEFSDYFSMFIAAKNVKEGYYTLPVQMTGKIQVDYSETDPSGYVWMSFNERVEIQFFVRSYVDGASDTMSIQGYESGNAPIYAGAQYMSFMGNYISPEMSGMENFRMDISLPGEYFNVHNEQIAKEYFSNYLQPLWKVDVSQNTPAGNYEGMVVFHYDVNDLTMLDGPYAISLDVVPTPLLIGPDTNNMKTPTYEVQQSTNEESMNIRFTNEGNVPLLSAKIKLDLDSAMFLQQKEFYYNEDDHASKVYPPLEVVSGELDIGESFTAVFPAVSLVKMLPPGDYLIPMDYELTYVDPLDESGAGIRLTSYQYDEIGREDYMDIMWFRSDPRPTDLKVPHIMLRVMDDDDTPDYELETADVLQTGDSGKLVNFRIKNQEYYDITDATIQVWSSDPSVVWNPNAPMNKAVLAEIDGVDLDANTFDEQGFIDLQARVDVSKTAGSGLFRIYTMVKGYNENLEQVVGNRSSTIQIKADPGRLDIASVATSDVKPGSGFTLTLTLINNGDVAISQYEIMVSCHDNMICVEEPLTLGSNVESGGMVTIDVKCKASECMDYEKSSQLFVLTKVSDGEGNQKDFTDGNQLPVNIMAAREPEELHTTNAVKSSAMYFFLAVLFASLIFAFTILGSIFLFLKARYGKVLDIGGGSKKGTAKKEEKVDKVDGNEKKEQKEPVREGNVAPPAQQTPQPQQQSQYVAPPAGAPQQQVPPASDPNDELSGLFDAPSEIDRMLDS